MRYVKALAKYRKNILRSIVPGMRFVVAASFVFLSGCGDDGSISCENNVTYCFAMVQVPGGTFPTGIDDNGNDMTASPFLMSETEVSYELWSIVYAWSLTQGYNISHTGTMGDGTDDTDQHPVTDITVRDVIVWMNALSEMAGLSPVYRSSGVIVRDSRDSNAAQFDQVRPDHAADGYRLPEFWEWECAARYLGRNNPGYGIESPVGSGIYWTPGFYTSGATGDINDQTAANVVSWNSSNSNGSMHAVKGRISNALGLYDMSGNAFEMVFVSNTSVVYTGGSWNLPNHPIAYDGSYTYSPLWDATVKPGEEGFRIVR